MMNKMINFFILLFFASKFLHLVVSKMWVEVGYDDLRETEPTPKPSNLASKGSFAIPSCKEVLLIITLIFIRGKNFTGDLME